jgi:hypothetical protein
MKPDVLWVYQNFRGILLDESTGPLAACKR